MIKIKKKHNYKELQQQSKFYFDVSFYKMGSSGVSFQ